MSEPGPLHALAFASADGSLWGAAVDGGPRAIVAGAAGAGLGLADGLTWDSHPDGDGWRLSGDGVALSVEALAPPAPGDDPPPPGTPYDGEGPELCTVRGTLAVAGGEVDVTGVRFVVPAPGSAKDAPASARFVGAVFPDGAALGLVAVRSRRVDHADGDVLSATVFDPTGWIAVADPRLSTTWDAAGAPTRCSLELWIADGEDEFPRRAAGEASGPPGAAAADGLALQVVPLRAHGHGEDGAGVYATVTLG